MTSRMSIIIPVYNESAVIEPNLTYLLAMKPDEIIVVDGGSSDDTLALARKYSDVTVIESGKGRGVQMNAGAAVATGDVLLFLHCDVRLPEDAFSYVFETLRQPYIAGRFRLQFDAKTLSNSIHTWATGFHFFSFGDQAFFMTRAVFEDVGGFNEDAFFEDVDFYKRLRQQGKVRIIKDRLVTASSRRYEQMGAAKQRMINMMLLAMGILNIDPRPMMRYIYRDIR